MFNTENKQLSIAEQKQFIESCMRQLFEMHGKIQDTFPVLKTKLPLTDFSGSETTACRLNEDLLEIVYTRFSCLVAELVREEVKND